MDFLPGKRVNRVVPSGLLLIRNGGTSQDRWYFSTD